ncbi:hypothetical protein [Komagataeibacter melaceti]|uniref:hypothetical protein n=1 Tax=Komagataeibacter melaceti TaxID=2766577 RepID=UPI001313FC28|nr:hypothetical protein [Komagataeibacter melaceti]
MHPEPDRIALTDWIEHEAGTMRGIAGQAWRNPVTSRLPDKVLDWKQGRRS